MRVYLTTAYPTEWSYLSRFKQLAARDRIGLHWPTESIDDADMVLFVDARHEHGEWDFRTMRQHPLVRTRPEACFVYDETDQPWCSLPGVYVSMPSVSFDSKRQRACAYIGMINDLCLDSNAKENVEPELLFSFSGRDCHSTRSQIFTLKHDRGSIENTSGFNFFGDANRSAEEMAAAKKRYAETVRRSKFVLCPRGTGTASFRLFETLAAGRVPVIISDDWEPISGPDWGSCSIRIAEKSVREIPRMLEEAEASWPAMAASAKHVWNGYFAPDVIWHRLIESCIEIMNSRGFRKERWLRLYPDRRYWRLKARHVKAAIFASRGKLAR